MSEVALPEGALGAAVWSLHFEAETGEPVNTGFRYMGDGMFVAGGDA